MKERHKHRVSDWFYHVTPPCGWVVRTMRTLLVQVPYIQCRRYHGRYPDLRKNPQRKLQDG